MSTRFVVLSGLPGSGKSTLARQLATALELPLIDKDTILQRMFESKGVGDDSWRRTLSRESDVIFQAEAIAAERAVLVSHWQLPGMSLDSGTPTDWLGKPSDHVVNVHCVCAPELAAERFFKRKRHPGHLDSESSYAEVLDSLRAMERLGPLKIGQRIEIDTSRGFRLDAVVCGILDAFARKVLNQSPK
jgi:gluconate kinase